MAWTVITSIFLLNFFGFPGIRKQRRQMLDELIQSRRIAQGFVADSEALSLEIKSSSNTLFVSLFIAGNHFLLASLAAWRYTWGHTLPQHQEPGLPTPVPSVLRTSLFFFFGWEGCVSRHAGSIFILVDKNTNQIYSSLYFFSFNIRFCSTRDILLLLKRKAT